MSFLVTGFSLLAPPPDALPEEGWLRLPDPRRDEIDPEKKDSRWAKLDRAARLLALVARRALATRALGPDASGLDSGLSLGTLSGCLEADERFDATRASEGGASPLLFPATLATAPAAELSIRLGLRGPIAVVSSGESSFLAALVLALRWLEGGEAKLVLACGLEVSARSAPHALGGRGLLVESAACAVIEPGRAPSALATIERAGPFSPSPPESAPGSGDPRRQLGNRGAFAFARALEGVGEALVSVSATPGASVRVVPLRRREGRSPG